MTDCIMSLNDIWMSRQQRVCWLSPVNVFSVNIVTFYVYQCYFHTTCLCVVLMIPCAMWVHTVFNYRYLVVALYKLCKCVSLFCVTNCACDNKSPLIMWLQFHGLVFSSSQAIDNRLLETSSTCAEFYFCSVILSLLLRRLNKTKHKSVTPATISILNSILCTHIYIYIHIPTL